MQKLKKIFKRILGYDLVVKLKSIKLRFFPSREDECWSQSQKELFKHRSEFYSKFIKCGQLCFDIGANIGNRTEVFLSLGVSVVAIEPQKSCCRILSKKYGDKIQLVQMGVGASEGILDFHISNESVLSSFSTDWIQSVSTGRFKQNSWNKTVKVKVTTLDKLIQLYGIPSFIKIDVEGFEKEVLKGLSATIQYISFEYTLPEQVDKTINCLLLLYQINEKVEFNYTIGENMRLELPVWVSYSLMKAKILENINLGYGFGDIYARNC